MVISAGALVKRDGEEMRGEPVELTARHQSKSAMAPYERLLGDAVRGDTALFTQDASVEAAWRVVDPILRAGLPVIEYQPGSWGPTQSLDVLDSGDSWQDPVIEKSLPC